MKSGKKTKRSSQKKYCDQLWANRVKDRDKWVCQRCKQEGRKVEAHHIFKRKGHSLRWEVDNGLTLCSFECHLWAETNPCNFEVWIRKLKGDDFYEKLAEKERDLAFFLDYDVIKAKLKEEK